MQTHTHIHTNISANGIKDLNGYLPMETLVNGPSLLTFNPVLYSLNTPFPTNHFFLLDPSQLLWKEGIQAKAQGGGLDL